MHINQNYKIFFFFFREITYFLQKKIVMRFKPFTEKNKNKKIGICSILGRSRIGSSSGPGSGSIIPKADPRIQIKMKRIQNTAGNNA